MFVLFAKSVSVAEAIMPMSITNKISFEKFILTPYATNSYILNQKTQKNLLGFLLLHSTLKLSLTLYMKKIFHLLRGIYGK